MTKKMTIKRINRKEIQIKNGPRAGTTSWKIGISEDGNTWYNAWASNWNKDWKEGQVVEFEYKETQWGLDIIPPKNSRGGYQENTNSTILMELAEIKAMITEMYKEIFNQKTDQPVETKNTSYPDTPIDQDPSALDEEVPF